MTDPSTDMVPAEPGVDLTQPPIYDSINERQMVLIKSQIAPRATDGEVAHFLQLCGHYGLDPFAREAWCAKSEKGDRLLIMVGRDGLRKIAQRQGIHVDGDVVREKDDLLIVRTPDGNRTVAHSYGNPATRGEVIGAWAECRKGGPKGVPLGYFYAPLNEYRPASPSSYSPWSKQVGVMILAAAERQAIRQATPLGGLLAVGEDEVINGNAEDITAAGDSSTPVTLQPDVEYVVNVARKLGHAGFASRDAAAMATNGQSDDNVRTWVARAWNVLEKMRGFEEWRAEGSDADEPDVQEADVVEPDPAPAMTLADRAESIKASIRAAEDAGDDDALAELAVEWTELRAEMAAAENPDQERMDV